MGGRGGAENQSFPFSVGHAYITSERFKPWHCQCEFLSENGSKYPENRPRGWQGRCEQGATALCWPLGTVQFLQLPSSIILIKTLKQ